jgi:phytoene dehydrogenase-like protein
VTGAESFDAIVIGAGTNGLVGATVLARAGRRVLLVERAEWLGGTSRPIEFFPGFHSPLTSFDAGWFPHPVARAVGLSAERRVEPEIPLTLALGDGESLSLARDPQLAATAIRRHSPRDAERWGAFAVHLRKLSGFLEALHQLPPPDIDATGLGELAPLLGLARRFRALGRGDMGELLRVLPMPVRDLLDDWFESDALKAAVAAGGVRDIRQGPRSGGTAFVLLHYLTGASEGTVRARPWWRDAPDTLSTVLLANAREAGVTIRARSAVARILVRDDTVAGVALDDGTEIASRAVLSTADPAHTLLQLTDPVWLDPEFIHAVRNIKFRGCTSYVCYALDRLPTVPGLENPAEALAGVITLTRTMDDLERAYDAAKYGAASAAPHVEITVPTLRWPALAPAGKHVLMARVQYVPRSAPAEGASDSGLPSPEADVVTAAIERAMPGCVDSVLHRTVFTPRDLGARYGVTDGALTHGELTLDQILFMRPVPGSGRYAMPIPGLYLGGKGAHPGPGVLGGPGWLGARRMIADGKRLRGGTP